MEKTTIPERWRFSYHLTKEKMEKAFEGKNI